MAGHNSRTGTFRSFSCDKLWLQAFRKQEAEKHCPSWLTDTGGFLLFQCITAQLPVLCCIYSLGTEQALNLTKAWQCLCPCRQAGVCFWAVLSAASEKQLWASAPGLCFEELTGFILDSACSMCPVSLHSACSADLSAFSHVTAMWRWDSVSWIHEISAFLKIIVRQPRPYLWGTSVWVEDSSKNLTLPWEKDKLSSSASLWGSIWVLWKCVCSLLPSATYTILSSVEDFQEGHGVLAGEYEA